MRRQAAERRRLPARPDRARGEPRPLLPKERFGARSAGVLLLTFSNLGGHRWGWQLDQGGGDRRVGMEGGC